MEKNYAINYLGVTSERKTSVIYLDRDQFDALPEYEFKGIKAFGKLADKIKVLIENGYTEFHVDPEGVEFVHDEGYDPQIIVRAITPLTGKGELINEMKLQDEGGQNRVKAGKRRKSKAEMLSMLGLGSDHEGEEPVDDGIPF